MIKIIALIILGPIVYLTLGYVTVTVKCAVREEKIYWDDDANFFILIGWPFFILWCIGSLVVVMVGKALSIIPVTLIALIKARRQGK